MKRFGIVTMCFFICTCKSVNPFDREHELNVFLHTHHQDTLAKENKFVFIYHNVACNSCFMGLFDSLNETYKGEPSKKIIIFTKHDSALLKNVVKLTNTTILFDDTKKLPALGLSYSTDLIIKFKDGHSIDWTEISYDNLKKIEKMKN